MEYFINSSYYPSSQLSFEGQAINGLNASMEQGTPILVAVEGKMAVIGIKTHRQGGLLFSQQHVNALLEFMHKLKIDKYKICHSRLFEAKHFDFREEEVKDEDFDIEKVFSSQQRVEIPNQIREYLCKGSIQKVVILLERAASRPFVYS